MILTSAHPQRRHYFISIFTGIVFCFLTVQVSAQVWTQKNKGLYGGNVLAFQAHGGRLFAGTDQAGIFVSDDQGNSWESSNTGVSNKWISSFAATGTHVFAGSYFGGVMSSVDNGDTWQTSYPGAPPYMGSQQVLCLATKGDSLFAGTLNGLYLSTDFGTSWTAQNAGLPSGHAGPLASVNSITLTNNVFVVGLDGRGAYKSIDQGANWTPINEIPSDLNVYSGLASGDTLYLGSLGTYRSIDQGSSWHRMERSDELGFIFKLEKFKDKLCAYRNVGLQQWSEVDSTWTSSGVQFTSSLFATGNELFVGSQREGIYHTTDLISFDQRNEGLNALYLTKLFAKDNFIFGATQNGLYRSSDQGKNWNRWNNLDDLITDVLVNTDTIIGLVNGSEIYRSLDNGQNWTNILHNDPYTGHQLLLLNKGDVYTASSGIVYVNHPGSGTWNQLNIGSSSEWVLSMAAIGDKLFAGKIQGSAAKVYVSSDKGSTWSATTNPSSVDFAVNDMLTVDNSLYFQADDSIFETKDYGVTWTAHAFGFTGRGIFGVHNLNSTLISATGAGALMSSDRGKTWVDVGDPYFSTLQTSSFVLLNDTVYAATSEGLWVARNDFGPRLGAFLPQSGPIGQSVGIEVKYISPVAALDSIRITGQLAPIAYIFPDMLIFTIPPGARKGPISLTVGGQTVTTLTDFCVIPAKPVITETSGQVLTSSSDVDNQWYFTGTLIPGATTQTYHPTEDGTYTVQVGSGDCVGPFSDDFAFTIMGIDSEHPAFSVTPNPVRGETTVHLESFETGSVQLRLVDMLGRTASEWSLPGGGQSTINLAAQSTGMYVLRANQGVRTEAIRIVKP